MCAIHYLRDVPISWTSESVPCMMIELCQCTRIKLCHIIMYVRTCIYVYMHPCTHTHTHTHTHTQGGAGGQHYGKLDHGTGTGKGGTLPGSVPPATDEYGKLDKVQNTRCTFECVHVHVHTVYIDIHVVYVQCVCTYNVHVDTCTYNVYTKQSQGLKRNTATAVYM